MSAAAALRVLLAEDEEHLGAILELFLGGRGHRVHRVRDGREALAALGAEPFDVALLDVMMPELDGLAVLRELPRLPSPPEAIVMTGNGTADVALSALQLGAYDYLTKPYRMAEVDVLVRRAAEKRALRREVALLRRGARPADPAAFVTAHAGLLATLADLAGDAGDAGDAVRAPLLVHGEPGSGRAAFARAAHARAARGAPLLELRCTGVADGDEAMLFDGRAAAPGDEASRAEAGALELAAGAGVLLRDAHRMAPRTLARLAGALEAGRFTRGEGGATVPLAARVLLAADTPIAFPPDGAVRTVALPPLRERPMDLAPLAAHLLVAAGRHGAPLALEADGEAWLASRTWPGNVAELRAVLHAAAARAAGTVDAAALAAASDAAEGWWLARRAGDPSERRRTGA